MGGKVSREWYNAWRRKRRANPLFRAAEYARENRKRRAKRKLNPIAAREADRKAYYANTHLWVGRRLKKYGLTFDEWKEHLAAQGFRCANRACSFRVNPGEFGTRIWATDHDHKTGTFRGILCHKCNRALGYANDDPNQVRGLAEYLEERR